MLLNTIMGGAILNSKPHIFCNLAFYSDKTYEEIIDLVKYDSLPLDDFPILFDNCSRFYKLERVFNLKKKTPKESEMDHQLFGTLNQLVG
jgi:hypothetical protein